LWKGKSVVGSNRNPCWYRRSKLQERHNLSNHLYVHYPISDRQWGFSHGKSTTAALLSFSQDCLQSLNKNTEICSVLWVIE